MEIEIVKGYDNRLPDAHVNVVIDVIRAFTFAHVAFRRGIRLIWLARTANEALGLKKTSPDLLLAGERDGLWIPGFDFDNSPYRLLTADLDGQYMVQKTTNGVTATWNALNARDVLVTGLTNARATARYIAKRYATCPSTLVHLVASHPTSDEDVACAEYILGLLDGTGRPGDTEVQSRIREAQAARKFFDPARPEFDSRDIEICEQIWDGAYVMWVDSTGARPFIKKVGI